MPLHTNVSSLNQWISSSSVAQLSAAPRLASTAPLATLALKNTYDSPLEVFGAATQWFAGPNGMSLLETLIICPSGSRIVASMSASGPREVAITAFLPEQPAQAPSTTPSGLFLPTRSPIPLPYILLPRHALEGLVQMPAAPSGQTGALPYVNATFAGVLDDVQTTLFGPLLTGFIVRSNMSASCVYVWSVDGAGQVMNNTVVPGLQFFGCLDGMDLMLPPSGRTAPFAVTPLCLPAVPLAAMPGWHNLSIYKTTGSLPPAGSCSVPAGAKLAASRSIFGMRPGTLDPASSSTGAGTVGGPTSTVGKEYKFLVTLKNSSRIAIGYNPSNSASSIAVQIGEGKDQAIISPKRLDDWSARALSYSVVDFGNGTFQVTISPRIVGYTVIQTIVYGETVSKVDCLVNVAGAFSASKSAVLGLYYPSSEDPSDPQDVPEFSTWSIVAGKARRLQIYFKDVTGTPQAFTASTRNFIIDSSLPTPLRGAADAGAYDRPIGSCTALNTSDETDASRYRALNITCLTAGMYNISVIDVTTQGIVGGTPI